MLRRLKDIFSPETQQLPESDYPHNREHKYETVCQSFGTDLAAFSRKLSQLVHETPRVGDLGSGVGYTSQGLSYRDVDVESIDSLPSPLSPNFHQGKYPEVKFESHPHLIVANQSLGAFKKDYPQHTRYGDINESLPILAEDVDPRVGTILIDSTWPIQVSIKQAVTHMLQAGFNLIEPSTIPDIGDRVHLILSRLPKDIFNRIRHNQ